MSIATADGEVRTLDFEDFFRSEFPTIFRAVALFTGSREAAEDISQEAFARAYSRWWRLHDRPWAGGWVMTTAINLCKKEHKRSATHPRVGSQHEQLGSESTVDVSRAVQALPPRQRTAVALFYLADLPLPQIAHLMQISEGSVKAHLAQARKNLRVLLEVLHD